jgi:hypothetical protein
VRDDDDGHYESFPEAEEVDSSEFPSKRGKKKKTKSAETPTVPPRVILPPGKTDVENEAHKQVQSWWDKLPPLYPPKPAPKGGAKKNPVSAAPVSAVRESAPVSPATSEPATDPVHDPVVSTTVPEVVPTSNFVEPPVLRKLPPRKSPLNRTRYTSPRQRLTSPKRFSAWSPTEPIMTRGARARGLTELAHVAMWTDVDQDKYYMSLHSGDFFLVSDTGGDRIPAVSQVDANPARSLDPTSETGFLQLHRDVPKSFPAALRDKRWGPAAQAEWQKMAESRCLVVADTRVAQAAIADGSATLFYLFPIFENKEKEGKNVDAVRLVADGRQQANLDEDTYAFTPAKEELLVLLHLASTFDWEMVLIDHKRAFLSVDWKAKKPAYARVRGDPHFYSVLRAIYGSVLSPKLYGDSVVKRMTELGWERKHMCRCIYTKTIDGQLHYFFHHVDDFLFLGPSREALTREVEKLRSIIKTTEPEWDPGRVLGYTLQRDRVRRIIKLTVGSKIVQGFDDLEIPKANREPHVPMPTTAYVIAGEDFDNLPNDRSEFLDSKGIRAYQRIVGLVTWLSGVRYDVVFALQYLSWFNQAPRKHHLHYAEYVMNYLLHTKDIPLVLGGDVDDLGLKTYTDASLGTAPKGKSVHAQMHRLSEHAGAVLAQTSTSRTVQLASFEAELDSLGGALKGNSRMYNILIELLGEVKTVPVVHCDNQAVLEFVRGNSNAKLSRYMDLRLFYIREKVALERVSLQFMPGVHIPTDKLTKLAVRGEFEEFRSNIQGLKLLQ